MEATDFTRWLLKDERIVWWGQPVQGLLLTSRDWLLIPLSLIWGCFMIFWEAMVLQTAGAPAFMKLLGVPVVLLGLYFMVGRFLLDAWIRRGMQYAVTNERVLISRSRPFSKFTTINLGQAPEASLSERADRRGTIRFGKQAPFLDARGIGFSVWVPSLDPTPQLIAIEDAQTVFDVIQNAAAKH
jgi:hypothetical protein